MEQGFSSIDGHATGPLDLTLLELTQRLVEIPSVSRNETQIADFVESILSGVENLQTQRIGDNLIARTQLGKEKRILLGGHLDTVPHPPEFQPSKTEGLSADGSGHILAGRILSGPGAVDMKGGIAIMLSLAVRSATESLDSDLTFLFYSKEEIAATQSGLLEVLNQAPEMLEADAAILLEPTGGAIEAGCQGTMRLLLKLAGKRSHTARAWKGINAIHRLAPVLSAINNYTPAKIMIEGCEYIEAMQVVSIDGGVAGNVVPDLAEVMINIRFAPDKDSRAALLEVTKLIESALGSSLNESEGDILEVIDVAESAMPSLTDPALAKLIQEAKEVRAKLGWTDVSFFYNRNVPALNLGPGDPELAHTTGEIVSEAELISVYEMLAKFIF